MAKTGFGNFDYVCSARWRGAEHQFHIAGNHSGSAFNATDAETFMTGASCPFKLSFAPFMAGAGAKVVAAKYYDGVNSSPIWEAFYDTGSPAPTNLEPTGTAYASAATTSVAMPLEVCVMLESRIGLGKTGKPVYNRKFLRGGPIDQLEADGDDSKWNFGSSAAAAAASLGDGSWFGTRVYISPSGGQGNTWVALATPGNHQVPRGRKRKTSSGSGIGSDVLRALGNAGLDVISVLK